MRSKQRGRAGGSRGCQDLEKARDTLISESLWNWVLDPKACAPASQPYPWSKLYTARESCYQAGGDAQRKVLWSQGHTALSD